MGHAHDDEGNLSSEDLRVAVYKEFATHGQAPELEGLAGSLTTDPERVAVGLQELARDRHVVLDDRGHIIMAHPFSAIPLGFAVMGKETLWWGGCAWDSFALPHVLPDEPEVLVSTRCPGCDRALAWVVGRDAPPTGDEVAHFLVPAEHMWDDVVHTCGNQRLFCDRTCVDTWLARTRRPRGYVMDLATLWRLASGWYAGRLEHGYTRREPAQASRYFREVGLQGSFWGL